MSFGVTDRASRLEQLASAELDLLIVGGGITGVAVARDAVMRGFSAACVEREDFAYGTSSRSSKLIHGGLRYLEQANFKLVFEGTRERATLRRVAAHLVRPIEFLVPVYESSKHGVMALGVGLWMYDQLAGKRRYKRHSRHNPEAIREREPTLRSEELRGGATYYDCMTDDARLCVENAMGAHERGAIMLNKVEFVSPHRNDEGRVTGALIRDRQTGKEHDVRCKVLVHCAGPWTDSVLSAMGDQTGMIRTSKGVHILFPHDVLPVKHAVVMAAVQDKRVVFCIPRGRVTLVGTTDTDFTGSPNEVHADSDDVDYLLATLAHYFPERPPTRADIRATYAGLRPLVRDDSDSPYDVSREHTVVTRDDATVTIGGGKYTTYRRMASDVVVAAMKVMGIKRKDRPTCPTMDAPLPGATDFAVDAEDATDAIKARIAAGVDEDIARYVVQVYAARHTAIETLGERLIPDFPYTSGMVDYAIFEEAATSVADILVRRLPVFYEAPDQGLECAALVADRLGEALGWDAERRAADVSAYAQVVADSRRWQNP
ncbi:MAG: glycerol-3-phosphate dehydrogenase [Myxococcota bacterium]|jgi:glycerol-3-phosphate dehydrogenase